MKHVFIVGSKGIPARYGGFETFVEKLTEYNISDIKYHVACMLENSQKSDITGDFFEYNNAECFNIHVPNIGSARAIYYDLNALDKAILIAKRRRYENPIFYVLACRIGPFIYKYKKEIEKIGGKLFVNPDGHEWLRDKWSLPVKKYWKLSEKLMIKFSDLVICDSLNIEKYIKKEYFKYKPKTIYISYGTDVSKSKLNKSNQKVFDFFSRNNIFENNYYLIVGRFVPENNYLIIIEQFIKSNSKKDLVIITNVEKNGFYKKILKQTNFNDDKRIKFVGTVYDSELLKYIRENAFAYIHGHEVGGTNPSLLEALASTKLNLLLDVGFNREVAEETALYWEKDNLQHLLNKIDNSNCSNIYLPQKSYDRIIKLYSWENIIDSYIHLFKNY